MGRPAGRAAEAIAIDREMATLYRQGMTLAEIGLRFGITRERVRQRLALAGVSRTEGGRGQGYCMARHLDEGPYTAGNVYICTCGQNSSDGYLKTPWAKRFPHLVKKPGALSLSAFEQRVADLRSQGFGRRQIAKQLSRPVGAVNWAMWHAKKLTPAAV